MAIFPEPGPVFRPDFVRAPAKVNQVAGPLAALRQRGLRWGPAGCPAPRWVDCWLPRAARDFQSLDLQLKLVSGCQTQRLRGQAKLPAQGMRR